VEVKKPEIFENKNIIKIQAEIIYDDTSKTDLLFYEFDKKYLPYVTKSADPYLLSLLPLAFDIGQNLKLNLPVDEVLLNNINKIQLVLKSWYPSKEIIPVETQILQKTKLSKNNKTGLFFSGGVDSFYAAIKYSDDIDYLIFILGFDISCSQNEDSIKILNKNLSNIAEKLQKEIIIISTNLRETRFKSLKWLYNYGFGLASTAIILESLYSKVLISANRKFIDYKNQQAGDHPDLVPLFSTSNTNFVLKSADKNRMEKIEFLSNHQVALENLRVCWKSQSFYNCSMCEKCFRTMVAFDLIGKLNSCSSFDIENYDNKKLSKIYIKNNTVAKLWSDLLKYAIKVNKKT